jgi:hypothetical protein
MLGIAKFYDCTTPVDEERPGVMSLFSIGVAAMAFALLLALIMSICATALIFSIIN